MRGGGTRRLLAVDVTMPPGGQPHRRPAHAGAFERSRPPSRRCCRPAPASARRRPRHRAERRGIDFVEIVIDQPALARRADRLLAQHPDPVADHLRHHRRLVYVSLQAAIVRPVRRSRPIRALLGGARGTDTRAYIARNPPRDEICVAERALELHRAGRSPRLRSKPAASPSSGLGVPRSNPHLRQHALLRPS